MCDPKYTKQFDDFTILHPPCYALLLQVTIKMMLSAFLLVSSLMAVEGANPTQLRVDLHLSHKDNREKGVFITLDNVYPQSLTPLLLSWALPTTITTQAASRVWITTANSPTTNTTVFDSAWVSSSLQHAYVPRTLLLPSRAYEWTVAVKDGAGGTSDWAPTQRFFTSGGNATWGASSPIWAPSCAGNPTPPSFARFHADMPLGSSPRVVLSALLYITGSPPIYNDPWNVTKLLGGYKLSINDTVWGVGPGRTSCGPLPPGINYGSGGPSAAFPPPQCTPVQPVDGYDVSLAINQALAAGATTLPLDIASYGLVQNKYNIVPAVQATLHVRWSPEGSSPDLIFGTSTTPGAWVALDGDGLYNPKGNKAPFWYTQPREDTNNSCLPSTPTAKPCNQCGWVTPVPAPGAWIGGSVPLAGKTTQALSFTRSPGQVDATVQLGPGWYRYDSGGEFQGGVRLELLPTSTSVPNGALALIQLSSQLAANGSALWNTRAGNHYQDAWRFPAPATATPQQRAIEHHEYSEFRYAEVIWSDALSGEALSLVPGVDFVLTFWAVHYPYDKEGATFISTSSPDLDAVFTLAATTLKTTTLDFYADSNSRQRSIDCMADETTAALNQYATTTELAIQRMTAGQFMGITPLGYVR